MLLFYAKAFLTLVRFVCLQAKTYLPQSYLVHEEMLITEKLESTSDLGIYINKLCKDKDVFRLQRRDTILGKCACTHNTL